MTVIAYRDGVLAADSRFTFHSDAGGSRVGTCNKLFAVTRAKQRWLIGLSGEGSPGILFLEWFKSGRKGAPEKLLSHKADFGALVISPRGEMFLYDRWCAPDPLTGEFAAIGSGSKAALAAMIMGAGAERACEVTTRVCPYCAPPIITLKL